MVDGGLGGEVDVRGGWVIVRASGAVNGGLLD